MGHRESRAKAARGGALQFQSVVFQLVVSRCFKYFFQMSILSIHVWDDLEKGVICFQTV